jgi:hypothetical protein
MATATAADYSTTAAANGLYYPLSSNPSSYLVAADIAGKADLASPTFTGTPSLPTGTIGVTQTAGNNTTALATTAFVTAAVPAFATAAQARLNTNTTNFLTPNSAHWLLMNPSIVYIQRAGFTVTNTGTIAFATGGWIASNTRLGTAGACSSRWRTFGLSQVDQTHSATDRENPTSHFNFSNPAHLSGRTVLNNVSDTVVTWAFYHGKAEGDGIGDLTRRGFGWKLTGGSGSRFLQLQVHDGTTLTSTTSSFAALSGKAFDWDLLSDGAGNCTLYVNGSSVASSSGGPTGLTNVTPAIWQEEVSASDVAQAFNGMAHSRGRLICFIP